MQLNLAGARAALDGSHLGKVLGFMRALLSVDHAVQACSKHMQSNHGVTATQRLLIRVVGRYPGISAGDVAAIMEVHPSTITPVLLRLERDKAIARQVDPTHITFRISAPVSVRSDHERESMGNRVSTWLVELPIGEGDPLEQVRDLREQTQELKRTRNALGMDVLISAAEFAPMGLISQGMHLASGPINSIVTNVPGPQFPLYMLGAKLISILPQVPLLPNIGLGIALMSSTPAALARSANTSPTLVAISSTSGTSS